MDNFWQTKSLDELSEAQWEQLCDGCARCCLLKLEDEVSAEVFMTNVACQLLDIAACRCKDYAHRIQKVPQCLQIKNMQPEQYSWLPATCAYRLLFEGKPLYPWHPLITGDANSTQFANITVQRFALSEEYIHPDQLEEHIIDLLD